MTDEQDGTLTSETAKAKGSPEVLEDQLYLLLLHRARRTAKDGSFRDLILGLKVLGSLRVLRQAGTAGRGPLTWEETLRRLEEEPAPRLEQGEPEP